MLGSDDLDRILRRTISTSEAPITSPGFYLTGGFIHLNNDVNFSGLEDGETETTRGSSNQYRLTVQRAHSLPNQQPSSLSLNRSSYSNDDSLGGTELWHHGHAVNGNLNLDSQELPVTRDDDLYR